MLLTLIRRGCSSLHTPLWLSVLPRWMSENGEEVPGEVLNRSLATSVRSIEAGKSTQQRRDNGDDLSTVRNVLRSFFQDEERSLGVDPAAVSFFYP